MVYCNAQEQIEVGFFKGFNINDELMMRTTFPWGCLFCTSIAEPILLLPLVKEIKLVVACIIMGHAGTHDK